MWTLDWMVAWTCSHTHRRDIHAPAALEVKDVEIMELTATFSRENIKNFVFRCIDRKKVYACIQFNPLNLSNNWDQDVQADCAGGTPRPSLTLTIAAIGGGFQLGQRLVECFTCDSAALIQICIGD
jgi:hypothetical protein